jgi:hypothetical protein
MNPGGSTGKLGGQDEAGLGNESFEFGFVFNGAETSSFAFINYLLP